MLSSTRMYCLAGLGVTAASALLATYVWHKREEMLWVEIGRVEDLIIYPIKSGHGTSVMKATATRSGLRSGPLTDRAFVVVLVTPEKMVHMNSGMVPMLATISAAITESSVVLSSPVTKATNSFDLHKTVQSEPLEFFLQATPKRGYDCGEVTAKWMQEVLYHEVEPSKRPQVRLIFVGDPETFKNVARAPNVYPFTQFKNTDLRLYHDTCAFHVTSPSSLDDLNTRLETPVTMNQFRSNIVVSGQPAFEEDNWAYVKFGDSTILRTLKPRESCIRINVRPDSGKRQNEVLDVMRKYRVPPMPEKLAKQWAHKPIFGLHMALDQPGDIAVGDTVYAVRRKPDWFL
ncbi:mitochondrial amidoxime-reducing component 1 isoform X2 [Hyalella azteca]|uniref:Mitochondrial amidoxime-reducing component 1 isoform X2 n=1 Tax=Hyalella azteca TaxID=294128 RepID=A0A8B7P0B6_HYAAZ|nr:mitochondrial amidoxime-reducing component 1 isoform X2 [Hyalella azteca]